MKLVKVLLATTFALTATTATFAATQSDALENDNVVVSTQELPTATEEGNQPNAAQPTDATNEDPSAAPASLPQP